MACVVTAVNDCTVDVKPAFQERVMDKVGRTVSHQDMHVIEDVPIEVIGGVLFVPNVGDHGLLTFHDVSLDEYLDSGQIVPLNSVSRHHDYTDAIFRLSDIRCSAFGEANIIVNNGEITMGDVKITQDSITVGDIGIADGEINMGAIEGVGGVNVKAALEALIAAHPELFPAVVIP